MLTSQTLKRFQPFSRIEATLLSPLKTVANIIMTNDNYTTEMVYWMWMPC